MAVLKWTRSREVFVTEIDDEHRTVFEAADELQRLLAADAPLYQIQESLHRLLLGAEEHFVHEEQLMRAARYEMFDWHKQQHNTARKRMRQFTPLIEQGDKDAGAALLSFLAHWLRDHTSLTDRMMGAFLRNKQRASVG